LKRLIFIFLILISSCNENKKTEKIESGEKTQPEFKLAKSDFVILTYQTEWYWVFKNAKPTELTQSELIEIENILKTLVKENNKAQKIGLIEHNKNYPENQRTTPAYELKIDGFKRQYVPIINDKGQKEVWINFFCDDTGAEEYWKTEIMIVDDGGNCYYNLKINLDTKEYYELRINGY
jgi:hypothetical protein